MPRSTTRLPLEPLPSQQQTALKEWAVVCTALAQGRQLLLFRTGGIHEGTAGFRPEHSQFWLFPTRFHQSLVDVDPTFAAEAETLLKDPPAADVIPIRLYGRVRDVAWMEDVSRLADLRPYHVLSDDVLRERFEYRRPGLFVLLLETWCLKEMRNLPADPRYDGCRSWVELEHALPTAGLERCIPEPEFAEIRKEILCRLGD